MKSKVSRQNILVIKIGGLTFIYLLLTGVTILLARSFLAELFWNESAPESGSLLAFFSIPVVLLIFFIITVAGIVKDFISNKPGSRFQLRLLANLFFLTFLAASPMLIITNLSISEVLRFWRTLKPGTAMEKAQQFALESYALTMEKIENHADKGSFAVLIPAEFPQEFPPEVLAVQDFSYNGASWQPHDFYGRENLLLAVPPALQEGIVPRELPRDANIVRYAFNLNSPGSETDLLRVISWNLGEDFDSSLELIAAEQKNLSLIETIRVNITRLLVYFYGLFFLPALIMTLIIAVSFTQRISSPITELSEAIRQVANGDFTVRLLSKSKDELSQLVRSFNSMVEDLERTQAAMLKAEKISAWQNLAQQLAHEIKNPLTPIRLSAERVLRRWQNEPEKIGEILEESMVSVIQEAEGISTLLTEFRTLSKPSEPSRTLTDLAEIVSEITGNYKPAHPNVNFSVNHAESGLLIRMDRIKLYQVLSNLLTNSIDAMNGSGSLEIRTDIVRKKESSYCRISIEDSGGGIPEECIPTLFVPYFTTKDSGTGLGLPIVERIVTDHGGSIWFNTAEGAGTTFFIDLPLEGKNA